MKNVSHGHSKQPLKVKYKQFKQTSSLYHSIVSNNYTNLPLMLINFCLYSVYLHFNSFRKITVSLFLIYCLNFSLLIVVLYLDGHVVELRTVHVPWTRTVAFLSNKKLKFWFWFTHKTSRLLLAPPPLSITLFLSVCMQFSISTSFHISLSLYLCLYMPTLISLSLSLSLCQNNYGEKERESDRVYITNNTADFTQKKNIKWIYERKMGYLL